MSDMVSINALFAMLNHNGFPTRDSRLMRSKKPCFALLYYLIDWQESAVLTFRPKWANERCLEKIKSHCFCTVHPKAVFQVKNTKARKSPRKTFTRSHTTSCFA